MEKLADTPILTVRRATNQDVPGIVATVRECFDEYGFSWEEDGYCSDLYDPETHYIALGNDFWVAVEGEMVVATVALEHFPPVPGAFGSTTLVEGMVRASGVDCSLERLYVKPSHRKQGLGLRLTQLVVDTAIERGRTALEIWSDKKLVDAHRLYSRFGALRVGERICDDPDESPEWGMVLPLTRNSALGKASE